MSPPTNLPAPLDDSDARPRRPKAFSGRVIFDHLPKTGGMAVNQWLRTALGEGCASPNLLMIDHRSLIARYGGAYSVLTAHVTFDRRGVDPRYQYVTLLREPIDRMVSWFYFIVNNHTEAEFGEAWHDAKRFLESDGVVWSDQPVWNPYVRHFAAIEGSKSGDEGQLLAAALEAVERYDVWGFYESMPEFLSDFAVLIGVPAPASLGRVNVTKQRPAMADLRSGLRARLTELNALDLEFYDILKGRHAEARRRWSRTHVATGVTQPLHRPPPLTRARAGFTLQAARIMGGEAHAENSLLEFEVAFSLDRPVEALVIDVTICDGLGSRVFTTNTTRLERPIGRVAPGAHRVRCTIGANLPTGEYSVGFRFSESLPGHSRDLAAFDGLAVFRIGSAQRASGPVTFQLPTTIDCIAVDGASITKGWRLAATDPSLHSHVGRIEGESVVSDGRAGFLLFGPYRTAIAGRWTAAVDGSFRPGAGCLRIDVASGSGRDVHASLEVTAPTERAELDFQLDHPVHDLEIRVWIHEFSSARIDAIAIDEAAIAEAAISGNDVHATATGCYGSIHPPLTGSDHDGLVEGRVATVREAAAAADPAATEATGDGVRPRDDERADGAAARGARAIGDPAGGTETERLGTLVCDAPVAVDQESCCRLGRTRGSRADDARRDAESPCPLRDATGSRLKHRPDPTFSIVIATDGRATALAELLDALPFLEGPPFEVCVVRGPTEDGVADVLDAWRGRIKIATNPIRNLSISRNIGIAMAAGEIVAFLDDDAIPETGWLDDLADAFHDPAVACVGGMNRDRAGDGLQYGHATANRMGQARWDHGRPADSLCVPGAVEFPYTQGTNTAIRRADLEALGGFDEEYDFYLDETDLCCRLIDAGRLIRQLPRAFVHHRSLPSAIRTPGGVTHSLHAVLKNKLYFSLVNNRGHHSTDAALADFESFMAIQERHLRTMAAGTPDGPRWLDRFFADAARARATGLARGSSGLRRLMSPGLVERYRRPFLPLARREPAERLACTLHRRAVTAAAATIGRGATTGALRDQRDLLRRTLAEVMPPGSRVALALYPDHHNVGDAAIWWGTRSLLRSLGVTVGYGCDPWSYAPERLATSVPSGPILLLGGGNFGDVYDMEQGLRVRILQDFPDRPVIQLPQSVWFRSHEARGAMAALFATHRDTTLLLRDAHSLAFCRTHFPVRSLLCPDAALALDLAGISRRADVPVVAVWRRDVESDLPLPPLPPGSIVTDWRDDTADESRRSWGNRAFRMAVGRPPSRDLPCPVVRSAAWRFTPWLWDALARERTVQGCRLLARGRVVITNRLHAHLLCTLMGIPHVTCDTVNRKLSSYRDTWETIDPLVRFASSPEEAVVLAEALGAGATPRALRAA